MDKHHDDCDGVLCGVGIHHQDAHLPQGETGLTSKRQDSRSRKDAHCEQERAGGGRELGGLADN